MSDEERPVDSKRLAFLPANATMPDGPPIGGLKPAAPHHPMSEQRGGGQDMTWKLMARDYGDYTAWTVLDGPPVTEDGQVVVAALGPQFAADVDELAVPAGEEPVPVVPPTEGETP